MPLELESGGRAGVFSAWMSARDLDSTLIDEGRFTEESFGDYHVMECLGLGGMGRVDLAIHAPFDGVERAVALKRLHPHLGADAEFVRMFRREMRTAARICHPHVCRVLDAGKESGLWYFAMDLLFGAPLSHVVDHLRTSSDSELHERWPAVVTRLLADACEGLHAAHELTDPKGAPLGVVHRDLSPENLFVGFDGAVRIIDFGIATARDRYEATVTGQVYGKPAYMAPERMRGKTADRRSDLFSLGVVAWECFAMGALFSRERLADTIEAVNAGLVPSLSEKNERVPLDIEVVVGQALSPDPARRQPDARRLGVELRAAAREAQWFADLPEVADWMDRLLPDVHQRQRRLAQHAAAFRMDDTQPTSLTE